MVLKILKWQVLRTLKSVLKHGQAAQKTERESESESEEVSQRVRKDILGSTRKRLTVYVKLEKKNVYNISWQTLNNQGRI
jgi:hypothetical protein